VKNLLWARNSLRSIKLFEWGAAMLHRRALQQGVKCRNAEHCDRGLTNTEYPGFSRDWALDVQYWTLKQMRISNVEYRIANVQQASAQVL
jgi:hypothetical protein